ncbi:MAG: hypothetical protein WCG85_22640 [Polyangia bacterium]
MSADSTESRLAKLLAQCTVELLSELGVQPQPLTGTPHTPHAGESVAAFSGFGNDEIRGSFTFLGPSKLFSRLHPMPLTVTPRDLTDWACELVNQSVGRFRNRLLAYGVKLALSVPQSALAESLRLASSLQPARSPIAFAIDGMVLEGWLELEIEPSFRLAKGPLGTAEEALKEGSMVLF